MAERVDHLELDQPVRQEVERPARPPGRRRTLRHGEQLPLDVRGEFVGTPDPAWRVKGGLEAALHQPSTEDMQRVDVHVKGGRGRRVGPGRSVGALIDLEQDQGPRALLRRHASGRDHAAEPRPLLRAQSNHESLLCHESPPSREFSADRVTYIRRAEDRLASIRIRSQHIDHAVVKYV